MVWPSIGSLPVPSVSICSVPLLSLYICSLCNKLHNLSVFIWSVFLSHELWNDQPGYLEATDESPSLPTQRDFLLAGPQRKPQAPQPHMCKAFAVDQLQMRK